MAKKDQIQDRPLVTVVVEGSTDKSGAVVRKTLDSLLAQTYPRELIELVFMDASVDGEVGQRASDLWSSAIVLPAAELPYYEMKNVGAERGAGEIVAFIDSDVTWNPTWIEDAVTHLTPLPAYSAVVGLTRYAAGLFSDAGTISQFGHHWYKYATEDHDTLLGVIANNFAIRRKEFLEVRYRFTQFRQGMDMVLASDLQLRGGTVRLVPTLRATHKWGWSKVWEHPQTAMNVGRGLTTALNHCDLFLDEDGPLVAHASRFGLKPKTTWLVEGSVLATSLLVIARYVLFSNYLVRTRRALDVPRYRVVPGLAFLAGFFSVIGIGALAHRRAYREPGVSPTRGVTAGRVEA